MQSPFQAERVGCGGGESGLWWRREWAVVAVFHWHMRRGSCRETRVVLLGVCVARRSRCGQLHAAVTPAAVLLAVELQVLQRPGDAHIYRRLEEKGSLNG